MKADGPFPGKVGFRIETSFTPAKHDMTREEIMSHLTENGYNFESGRICTNEGAKLFLKIHKEGSFVAASWHEEDGAEVSIGALRGMYNALAKKHHSRSIAIV